MRACSSCARWEIGRSGRSSVSIQTRRYPRTVVVLTCCSRAGREGREALEMALDVARFWVVDERGDRCLGRGPHLGGNPRHPPLGRGVGGRGGLRPGGGGGGLGASAFPRGGACPRLRRAS